MACHRGISGLNGLEEESKTGRLGVVETKKLGEPTWNPGTCTFRLGY